MMRRNADRAQRLRVAAAMVLALGSAFASAGCLSGPLSQGNAANPNLDAKVYAISCDDGRRYAARTFKARNYRITSVARSGSETTVDARNDAESFSARLTVTCGADGVMVRPSGAGQWKMDGLRFGFYQVADAGDRIWPPPKGPVVKMELYRGPESVIEFPVDLDSIGVAAVRARVINAGERTLRIDPRRIHATSDGGAEVAALAPADAERKLAGIDPDIKSKLLQPTKLKQGESIIGFVFFPTGDYNGASLALIDDQTGEADDYDVSFATS
jgi:hypothetical protein